MPDVPALTVLTIGSQTASECRMVVGEIRRQTIAPRIEMILVSPNREGFTEEDTRGFWGFTWVNDADVSSFGEAMAAAVRVARAPWVVYAEEHSYFDEDWAGRLVAAHEAGHPLVGFAIENANPGTLVSWAHLYGQFGPAVAPVATGETPMLTGHHVSYSRELLLGYGDQMAALLEDESALFLDQQAKGLQFHVQGDAISRHVNISRLPAYIGLDFIGSRSFAHARAVSGRWPWWKRLVYAGASPLIPLVRLRRILRDIRRTGRSREFLPRILGPIGLALAAGALGEAIGYLLGPGNAARQKAPLEFQRAEFTTGADRWNKEAASR